MSAYRPKSAIRNELGERPEMTQRGHPVDFAVMELQAVRYAAMVSHMTFAAAVRAHQAFIDANQIEGDAEERILEHLGWDEPQEEEFASEITIVLASAEFSKELTTAVIWLGEHDIGLEVLPLQNLLHLHERHRGHGIVHLLYSLFSPQRAVEHEAFVPLAPMHST